MKKYFYILVLISITSFACKKEATLAEPATFASVVFNDPFAVFAEPNGPLKINYQGKPIEMQTGVGSVPGEFKVLAGEAEFEFINSATGAKVLTKKLDISNDRIKTYVFFKPDPNAEGVELLENNQLSEPRPAADHIKIKVANFAQALLGNQDIKIVFSQDDAPVDTIQTTGSEFTDGYTEMNCAFSIIRGGRKVRKRYSITFLDKNNSPVLGTDGFPIIGDFAVSTSNYDLNLYTIIIAANSTSGQAPQLNIPVLFED